MSSPMRLIVSSRSIKQFAKTLQCLAKIGEDLYLCATQEHIKFITVNAPKSTFVEVKMSYSFLESYDGIEPSFGTQYKIRAKQCYQMFSSTKNIEKCCILVHQDTCQVAFHMLCKNNIQKVYHLNCELASCANALYSKDTPHQLTVKSKTINECLSYFSNSLEELSFQVLKDRFTLKSYIDNSKKGSSKMLQTEITIDYADFDQYLTDGSNAEISFAFKDAKTIMAFCDAMATPVDMYFNNSGDPFLIHVKLTREFEIDFVIATLITHNTSQPSSQSSSNNNNTHNNNQHSASVHGSPSNSYLKGSSYSVNNNNFSPPHNSQGSYRQNSQNIYKSPNYQQQSQFRHPSPNQSDHYIDNDNNINNEDEIINNEPMDNDFGYQSQQNVAQSFNTNYASSSNQQQTIYNHTISGDLSTNIVQQSPLTSQNHQSSGKSNKVSLRAKLTGRKGIDEDDDDDDDDDELNANNTNNNNNDDNMELDDNN